MDLTSVPIRHVAWCLYAIGFMLCLAPLMELAAGLGSVNPGAVPWRFGALGLMSGALVLPLVGIGTTFAAAVALEHRGMVRFLTAVAILLLVTVVGAIVIFGLDALQVRSQITQSAKRAFDLATIKAALTYATEILVLLVLSLNTLKAGRAMASRASQRKAESGTLVVAKSDR